MATPRKKTAAKKVAIKKAPAKKVAAKKSPAKKAAAKHGSRAGSYLAEASKVPGTGSGGPRKK